MGISWETAEQAIDAFFAAHGTGVCVVFTPSVEHAQEMLGSCISNCTVLTPQKLFVASTGEINSVVDPTLISQALQQGEQVAILLSTEYLGQRTNAQITYDIHRKGLANALRSLGTPTLGVWLIPHTWKPRMEFHDRCYAADA